MTAATPRSMIHGLLRRFRCDVRLRREPGALSISLRHPKIAGPPTTRPQPPRLFDDPLDALYHIYGGKSAAFVCPIDKCVCLNGLSFAREGWHPFTDTLDEYGRGEISGYEGSSLQRYFEAWQPQNLREAFFQLPRDEDALLDEVPGHLLNLYPWSAKSVAEAGDTLRSACYRDYVEHGHPGLTVDEHGWHAHGPVSPEVMHFEFERLTRVYRSLASAGYRRECGDVRGLVLRRGDDYRFILSGGGLHRVAATKVLGYETVPATFNNVPTIFDRADVPRWAQVTDGVWSRRTAEAYVDHMFDFDARAWARQMQLHDDGDIGAASTDGSHSHRLPTAPGARPACARSRRERAS